MENIFEGLVAVQCPIGSNKVVLDGIVYEADAYGVIRVEKPLADRLLKDRLYKLAGKRNGRVDPTASPTQASLSKQVAEDTAKAEAKVAELPTAVKHN